MNSKKILSCLIVIFLTNCMYKTFRDNRQVEWKAKEANQSKIGISISKDSTTDTCYLPIVCSFLNIQPMSENVRNSYKKIVIENLENSKSFEKYSTEPDFIELKLDFKHNVYRKDKTFTDKILTALIFGISLGLIPANYDEIHKVTLTASNQNKIIFTNESSEEVVFRVSPWFILLMNFYNNSTARDRIFYEHSSVLLKEFYEGNQNNKGNVSR